MTAGADTAKLLASLDLQDQMSPKLKGAIGNVAQAENRVSSLGTKLSGLASNLKGGIGSAFSTFGGRVKQIGLGLAAGLGVGGILSIGGAIKTGLDKAQSFGDEVRRLIALTGQSAPAVSAMAAAMEHFGITEDSAVRLTGFLEKTLGNLAAKKNGITNFEKTYGVALRDSNGHLKTANDELLTLADYWNNKGIPQSTKAAALTKLLGKSWQELIPFLSAGRQGITDAEAEAAKLGLTLSKDNVDALAKLKGATNDWHTALGGLELQIGLKLVPHLTDLAKWATSFVSAHGDEIVKFFGDAADFAGHAASEVADLAGKIGAFWNSIPQGVRDLLVKGIVADRTVKFLFGISPIKIVASLAESALGGLAKQVGQSVAGAVLGNKVFVQHVWVDNPGGAGGGAPGGPGAPGGGAINTLVTAAGGFEIFNELQHLPGEIAGLGAAFSGLANKDLPSAKSGLQAFIDSMTGLNPFGPNPALFQTGLNSLPASPTRSTSGGLSPDERQAISDQKTTQAKLDALRSSAEANRIRIVSAQESGTGRIVAAIKAARTVVHVTVNNRTVTSVYATGRTVTHTASVGSYNAGLSG